MFATYAMCRQAATAALVRGLTALQLSPSLGSCHLQQAWVSSCNNLNQPLSDQARKNSGNTIQQRRYRRVVKAGNRWYAAVSIPQRMLLGSTRNTTHFKCGFASPEAAAHHADILKLALHGEPAQKVLNFPHSSYTGEQIDEQQAELLHKYPNLNLQSAGVYLQLRLGDPSGFQTAAAAAASRVAGKDDGSRVLVGCSQDRGTWRAIVTAAGMTYTLRCNSRYAAACAYDLVLMALYGPTYSVNFPPDTYDSSWVEAAAQDIQLTEPGMMEAAQLKPAPADYYCSEAARAAKAAAAVEAAAAMAAGCEVSSNTMGFIKQGACAADMMRLVLGRPAVNLPSHSYNDSSIAAMRAWMQLDAERQAAWAAKKKQIERPKQPRRKVTGKQLGRG